MTPQELGEFVEERSYKGALRAFLEFNSSKPVLSELPENLTRKESAKLLRVSLVTLHCWSRAVDDRPAIITPIRINGRVRYKRDEVLALLDHSPKYRHRN